MKTKQGKRIENKAKALRGYPRERGGREGRREGGGETEGEKERKRGRRVGGGSVGEGKRGSGGERGRGGEGERERGKEGEREEEGRSGECVRREKEGEKES